MVFVLLILPVFDTDLNSQIKCHLKVLYKGGMSVMLYSLMTETLWSCSQYFCQPTFYIVMLYYNSRLHYLYWFTSTSHQLQKNTRSDTDIKRLCVPLHEIRAVQNSDTWVMYVITDNILCELQNLFHHSNGPKASTQMCVSHTENQ